MPLEPVSIRELRENPVKCIAEDWALLSAGTPAHWNTMTVSWGGVGEIWGFDAAFVFVRPQRYTYGLLEQSDFFTLSFGLPRATLQLCGKISGREGDKIARAGLHARNEGGAIWPAEAKLVLLCHKAAAQDLNPAGFLDPAIEKNYPGGDYHRMYIGEIVQVYRQGE
ncbi:MAG: flavin reductase family protein [Oscillospiraceae bacterium]|jgi:flavin reductase (DIM6/NTAB) family NADH-FMN oxidoreductase RutF|nr:flavin reductase family protein [Oscillospiraceae bacterium]